MKQASLRFYAELNDFLPSERRMRHFSCSFHVGPSVRDLIESVGVPHTEVDLILANGESVDFDYRVADGDRVSVFPVFESFDIAPLARVRPQPLRDPRFVADVHLGRLAAYLRMLGFDTLYRNDYGDDELARVASGQERILLTRDRGLLKRGEVTRGYYVREIRPRPQLAEVLARFDLARAAAPFTRCLACNAPLVAAEKGAVAERVPPAVCERYDEFLECPECRRVFWKGTHHQRMNLLVERLLG
jgi:uncharacterized protein with PIN domain/molybdopterin converting factor small subunit